MRYSLQQHFADFRRPERFDTESEDGYRFEVVNLYAAPISKLRSCAYVGRQGDIAVFIYRDDVPFFFHRYAVLR